MVTLFTYCLTFEGVSSWLVRKGEPVQQRTEFPFIAFLTTAKTMCTGSLVSTKAVLTAGHCVCSPMPVVQVAFLTLRNGDQQGIHHRPSGVVVAPEYMPSCTASRQRRRIQQTLSGFDIAIVLLAEMVNLQTGIKVLSLPQPSDIPTPGTSVLIVGYGRDDNDRDPSRRSGGILKKGRATVMECKHSTTGNPICVQAEISFLSLSEFEQRTINHQPSEIKVAPDYYPVCQLKRENKRITKSLSGYDMAIITLTNSVNLETGIKVVSLATESDIPIPESIVYMVGYGQDVKDSDPAGRNGGILKKGSSTVMACRHKTYGNPICVKPGPNSKQIAGPGDSGGPLLFSPQGPIIGVASSGVVLSSLADLCVEYSSVARMLKFILFNI
ncbi:unnamed protein product [Schistosoma margrebowiei]|uniref:Uncharacterized protein n=1 Tax=Schistosoma margrebowiei TaxID=48269 RepID=A0A183MMA2_9TREM|nr:unnamed protein product [Schistosoma margrebowiei]